MEKENKKIEDKEAKWLLDICRILFSISIFIRKIFFIILSFIKKSFQSLEFSSKSSLLYSGSILNVSQAQFDLQIFSHLDNGDPSPIINIGEKLYYTIKTTFCLKGFENKMKNNIMTITDHWSHLNLKTTQQYQLQYQDWKAYSYLVSWQVPPLMMMGLVVSVVTADAINYKGNQRNKTLWAGCIYVFCLFQCGVAFIIS